MGWTHASNRLYLAAGVFAALAAALACVPLSAEEEKRASLELRLDEEARWLDVDTAEHAKARLFTARVDRLRVTYTFTARSFARLIGQYVSTRRDPALYASPVAARDGTFTGSALLAYKLNWQTVLYAGYGDDRELTEASTLAPSERQLFVKLSYAFQR